MSIEIKKSKSWNLIRGKITYKLNLSYRRCRKFFAGVRQVRKFPFDVVRRRNKIEIVLAGGCAFYVTSNRGFLVDGCRLPGFTNWKLFVSNPLVTWYGKFDFREPYDFSFFFFLPEIIQSSDVWVLFIRNRELIEKNWCAPEYKHKYKTHITM